MNKLQLYITKSVRGYKNLVNFNPAEDVSTGITDVRDALAEVDYDPAEKNIFYLLRYSAQGVFVVILRTIPDKALDHLAAWIYVPNGLQINATELEEVVRAVTRKVSGSGVSENDIADLRRLFAREYIIDREAPSMVAMDGDTYAFSYYATDDRQLSDFFGNHLFQPAYTAYKGVLLLDANLGIAGRCTDITAEKPAEITAMYPPEDNASEFTPYIYGLPFNRPFLAAVGSDVTITWQRPGFEPQQQVVTVGATDFRPEGITTDEAIKTINSASFLITSQDTKEPLTGCIIKVNGREIKGPVTFTQSELDQAQVWVSCEGFFPYSARMDLASTTRALVQMQERRKVYRFELPLKSADYGGPVQFEIRSKREITDSPVEGYAMLDTPQEGPNRTNYLAYRGAGRSSMMQKAIYAAAGLVVGILIAWLCGRCTSGENSAPVQTPAEQETSTPQATVPVEQLPQQQAPAQVQEPEKPAESKPAEPTAQTTTTTAGDAEAIAYLDSKKQWDRTEMEKYPLLRGLWDDMNTYKLAEIRDVWAKKLAGSENFKKVVDAATKSINKNAKLTRNKSHSPTYNPPSDNVIGFVGWTYYVDP